MLGGLLRYGGLAWRPGGMPGTYVCRAPGEDALAAEIGQQAWVGSATLCDEYLTVAARPEALERVAVEIVRAGPDCLTSDALRGHTVPAGQRADLAAAPDWQTARIALAAELTASLAAAAGARLTTLTTLTTPRGSTTGRYESKGSMAGAVAYADADAVRFALARTRPGRREPPSPEAIARHVLGNPAYAVRYAHAAAAAVLRWAGTQPGDFRPRRLTAPGELALLDALSWLPERVAVAARRGRPDEFARYLETLASRTIDIMSTTSYSPSAESVPSERLWLAEAARTGLAAGLGLLGISAPDRL